MSDIEINIDFKQAKQYLEALTLQGKEFIKQMNDATALMRDMKGYWEGQNYADCCEAYRDMQAGLRISTITLTRGIPSELLAGLRSEGQAAKNTEIANMTLDLPAENALEALGSINVDPNKVRIDAGLLRQNTSQLYATIGVAGGIVQKMPETLKSLSGAWNSTSTKTWLQNTTTAQDYIRKQIVEFRETFKEKLEAYIKSINIRVVGQEGINSGITIDEFLSGSKDRMDNLINEISAAEDWKKYFQQ